MAFPGTDLDIVVEVFLGANPSGVPNEDWPAATDLSSRLLRKPIQIRRGRGTNQKTAQAGSCTLWLDNTDGALTPLLPTSTYYPDWDLGCPLRVSVAGVGAFPPYVRHAGFVAEVEAVMVPGVGGENISAVKVTSAGVLRRLTQGSVAKSGLRRIIEADDPYAYWALDDGPLSLAGKLTSGVGGDFGATDWGTGGGVNPGSAEVSTWLGTGLELAGDTAILTAEAVFSNPLTPQRLVLDVTFLRNAGSTNSQVLSVGIFDRHTDFQTVATQTKCWAIQVDCGTTETTAAPVLLAALGAGLVFTDGTADVEFDPTIPHHLRIDLTQNGADIDAVGLLDGITIGSGTLASNTLTGFSPQYVRLLHNASVGPDTGASVVYTDVALWVDAEPPDEETCASLANSGFSGEQAHERIQRNCNEEDVPYSGTATLSNECGPQPIGDLVAVLQDAEAIDHGMLIEDFGWGFDYRASSQRENLDPAITVDLATYRTTSGTQGDVLTPVRNDARLRNEWTVTRPGGSSATARDETNIAKRGRFNDSATVNVETDARALDEAQWRVHEGTFDKLRYETLPLDIAANLGS